MFSNSYYALECLLLLLSYCLWWFALTCTVWIWKWEMFWRPCLSCALFVSQIVAPVLNYENQQPGGGGHRIFTKQSQLFESRHSTHSSIRWRERWRVRQRDRKMSDRQISRTQTNRRCDRVTERVCYASCWGGTTKIFIYFCLFKCTTMIQHTNVHKWVSCVFLHSDHISTAQRSCIAVKLIQHEKFPLLFPG